eukprot:GEZU01001480.1.p1 GENE.GEZU01001480.1~~GEZU01001480.1.p1  ORF type:complete len:198 (+),score=24.98 GEZU01001480.1:40-633(+)
MNTRLEITLQPGQDAHIYVASSNNNSPDINNTPSSVHDHTASTCYNNYNTTINNNFCGITNNTTFAMPTALPSAKPIQPPEPAPTPTPTPTIMKSAQSSCNNTYAAEAPGISMLMPDIPYHRFFEQYKILLYENELLREQVEKEKAITADLKRECEQLTSALVQMDVTKSIKCLLALHCIHNTYLYTHTHMYRRSMI